MVTPRNPPRTAWDFAEASVSSPGGSSAINTIAVKPEVDLGIVMGGGWRLILSGGYLNVPSPAAFSGFTFGVRLDHKLETTIRSVDD